MELWEFNACVKAFKDSIVQKSKERTVLAWQVANFVSASFSCKLRNLEYYIKDEKQSAPTITKDEFEAKLLLVQKEVKNNATEDT